jgi:hypothetical protein
MRTGGSESPVCNLYEVHTNSAFNREADTADTEIKQVKSTQHREVTVRMESTMMRKSRIYQLNARKLSIVPFLIFLVLAACTPAATPEAPAPTVVPTVAVEEAAPTEEATEEATAEAETEPTPTTVPESEATEEATAEATEEATQEATEEATEEAALRGCLEPTGDQQLISSTEAGYCFLIPAGFERSEFSDDEGFNLGIYGPASTPGHRERAFVTVTESDAENAEAAVQTIVDDVIASLPGFTPTQSAATLGGLPAVQVDNLPGQDINRKVYALYEGRLYELTFIPFEESRPDAYAEAEELYTLVMDSFRFMPATDAASSYAPLLAWEGEIDGACYRLEIESDGNASVAVCGDQPSKNADLSENMEWIALQQHFGSIDAETEAGKISFQGQGNAESDKWAQALATWANFTAMEINAGRTGASARTTLAWQLTTRPEHSGLCSQVIILAYGYAYANQIPCDGNGQATLVGAGWLSDAELDMFSNWVSNGERIESELGYFDAQGSEPIDPEVLTAWANGIYTRLLQ